MINTTMSTETVNSSSTIPSLSASVLKAWSLPDVLLILIGIVGFVGNLLVCVVFLSIKKLRTTTNSFIVSLAFADLISSLMFFVKAMKLPIGEGAAGHFYCHVMKSDALVWICVKASVLNLVAVTFERLSAIAYPLRHKVHFTKNKARVLLVSVWLGAVFFESFAFYRFRYRDGKCVSGWPDGSFRKLVAIVNFLVTYLLPSLFLFFAYLKILSCLKAQAEKILSESNNQINSPSYRLFKARRKMIFVLILVSAIFNLCWTPVHTVYLLNQFEVLSSLDSTYFQFFVLVGFFNSCLNPFVYAFMNDHFRKGFVTIISPGRSRNAINTLASINPAQTSVSRVPNLGRGQNDAIMKC